MKILILGQRSHQFIISYVENLRQFTDINNLNIDILSYETNCKIFSSDNLFNNIYDISTPPFINRIPIICKIYSSLKFLAVLLFLFKKGNYDIIHIHYIENLIIFFRQFIVRNIKSKFIITIWGSDYLKASISKKNKMSTLFDKADYITIASTVVLKEFLLYYNKINNIDLKTRNVVFGLTPLEELVSFSKVKSNIINITIGYNARENQQHLEIIKLLENDNRIDKFKNDIKFTIPLTYPSNKNYIEQIKLLTDKSKFDYDIITKFLNNEEVADIRKNTDIFIQLQKTDMLSGSMLEHLAANNIVITGSWLPYSDLEDNNIYFIKITSLLELGNIINSVLKNFKEFNDLHSKNSILVLQNYRWQSVIKKWVKLYYD